jgi:pyruvate dehydrogenase E2 component (dihydrolipoamide acetyltransferase)
MADMVVMPQLGNSVTSSLITSWLVSVGESVRSDTPICEIETDKSVITVESGFDGTVLALLVAEGDDVAVKTPIAVVGAPGESLAGGEAIGRSRTGERERMLRVSPRARAWARHNGVSLPEGSGSGPHGRIIESDLGRIPPGGSHEQRAEPAAAAPLASPAAAVARRSTAAGASEHVDIPLEGIRRITAQRMVESLATSAQLTFHASAPAQRLISLRNRLKADGSAHRIAEATIGTIVALAVAKAVRSHPLINAHALDGAVRTFTAVHLGIAVDTPRGLIVPTIPYASSMALSEFSEAAMSAIVKARTGALPLRALTPATFTVTNLGRLGVEYFTPILNPPQVAILGVGSITPSAATAESMSPSANPRIGLSLTVDHRIVAGADAARALAAFVEALTEIDLTLLT